jgi:O-antigen/teichoic acid export membrane protein
LHKPEKNISDTSTSQLLKGSTIVFGLNAASKVLTTGLKSLIAHLLGPTGLGVYELVLALTRFLSMIPQMGLHQTIVQFISIYRSNNEWNQIRGAVRFGLIVVLSFSIVISTVLLFGLDTFRELLFGNEVSVNVVLLTVFLIPLFSAKNFLSLSFRGLKKYGKEIFYNNTLFPFLVIISVILFYLLQGEITIEFVLMVTLCSVLISMVGAFIAVQRQFISLGMVIEKFREKKRLLTYSIPVWFNTVLSTSYSQLDRIFLGLLSTVTQVGLYASAYVVALLISFVLNSFNPIFQPLFAESYANRDVRKMKALYQKVVNWTSYLVFPILGGIFLFGDSVLKIVFGAEFVQAYPILLILAFAECVNALAGPSGNILLMAERQKESAWILGIGFIIGVFLNLILIPYFDALGAAIGTGVGLIIINYLRVYIVRKRFKIALTYLKSIWAILIVLIAVISTYLFSFLHQNIYVSFIIYSISISLMYYLFLDTREIVRHILRRIEY